MENLQEKYDALIKRYNTLLDENEELKSILLQHGIIYPARNITNGSAFSSITFPPIKLSLDEKVALFRSFFKGREDVFARRWFSKTTEKVAINRSVSTNGTEVPVTKTKQVHRMPEPKLCSFDKPKHLSPFGGKR